MPDPYHLQRFVDAQNTVYGEVTEELRRGQKRSHWMWFIFPQLKGLGRTETARYYGIASLEEARAYLNHPILGPRLLECTHLVLQIEGRNVHQILGSPDDLKLRSSLTLFAAAATENALFFDALDKFYDGEPDPLTAAEVGPPQRSRA
ncbi:DUF1810 domain-containing protein [Undibacterium sp.]|jgi:uncharacterized protein (DUF1810 family)|uniref:DUF1810 domain-containing protein n=1 Tax=Undibacterium sp. TaxID=1914977 RepID=UPI002BF51125|nr:DUF1810 domain-containing protein [Undibacterium sp.]HTD05073.1 DUF1810 domain-containing protein [Undibacterium sp.]